MFYGDRAGPWAVGRSIVVLRYRGQIEIIDVRNMYPIVLGREGGSG